MGRPLFTSESVSEGHPDKICDQVSDAVLDAFLAQDPEARVACETAVTTGLVLICGEITSRGRVEISEIARRTIRDIGYTHDDLGFNADGCGVVVAVHAQSPDIALGVDARPDKPLGAGDQGMMFGFACDETEELMPLPIMLAHRLVQRQAEIRRQGTLPYLRPDAKSQVTVEYDDQRPVRIHTVVLSTQHAPDVSQQQIREEVIEHIIRPSMPAGLFDGKTIIHVNPTGRFVVGGPHGDSGLTGRKIIVDTYGGMGRHGGGAFSGKDPSKVDRSASYAARWIAKNIVAAGAARRCEVQLSYAIGVADPVSINVETFCTSQVNEQKLVRAIRENFDLTPAGIIRALNLRRPIYEETAAYGHFGRRGNGFTWEDPSMADVFRNLD